MPTQEGLKKLVGYKAVDDHVRSGMVVGLGTGSTAFYAVQRVGELLASGSLTSIVAVPTSVKTYEQAKGLGIPLGTLESHPLCDVSIDGADSVDSNLNLVKGGGGALLREKMVESSSSKLVIIVDKSKLTGRIGRHFPLPVEVVPFCVGATRTKLAALPSVPAGTLAVLRMGSSSNNKADGPEPAVTDNGCNIVDLFFEDDVEDVVQLGKDISGIVGVVEHGLFVGMADCVIVAGDDGIEILEKKGK